LPKFEEDFAIGHCPLSFFLGLHLWLVVSWPKVQISKRVHY